MHNVLLTDIKPLEKSNTNSEFVCLFVCLFTRSLRAETHLRPDGTRLEQNAQARL